MLVLDSWSHHELASISMQQDSTTMRFRLIMLADVVGYSFLLVHTCQPRTWTGLLLVLDCLAPSSATAPCHWESITQCGLPYFQCIVWFSIFLVHTCPALIIIIIVIFLLLLLYRCLVIVLLSFFYNLLSCALFCNNMLLLFIMIICQVILPDSC